jgi:hypothetical protein
MFALREGEICMCCWLIALLLLCDGDGCNNNSCCNNDCCNDDCCCNTFIINSNKGCHKKHHKKHHNKCDC